MARLWSAHALQAEQLLKFFPSITELYVILNSLPYYLVKALAKQLQLKAGTHTDKTVKLTFDLH